jgi:phage terminase small subunit
MVGKMSAKPRKDDQVRNSKTGTHRGSRKLNKRSANRSRSSTETGEEKSRCSKRRKKGAPGPLKNTKHEAFAHAVVRGDSVLKAYERAGFRPHHANAYRLRENEGVSARIDELRGKVARRMERSLEVDTDRLTKEFARVGLANITDIVTIKDGQVSVADTDGLSDDTTAAIAEIRETKEGLVVKMHGKAQALENLAKHLGYYKEPSVNLTLSLAELVKLSYRDDLPELPPPMPERDCHGR